MKRTKRGERLKMALASGNVYADLGFKDADAMVKAKAENLRFQIGTSNSGAAVGPGHGGRPYLPYAFTEEGLGTPRHAKGTQIL